ncbi:HAD family hydrolase [Homoserinimonas sp. A447]
MHVNAVLFDWRGTLVVAPTLELWAADALERAHRDASRHPVDDLVARISESNGPHDRMDAPGLDSDRDLHRVAFMGVFADAGVDDELAEALYESELDHAVNPFAIDAAHTIFALKSAGLQVGIVSDIHFDLRPAFAAVGLADAIDSYSLSYEVGVQKPSKAIYAHALEALGTGPDLALMVGDRAGPDGGAVTHGIRTLLLPPLLSTHDERLHDVLKLAL